MNDYENQKVNEILNELGEFNYDEKINGVQRDNVEYRPLVELKGARYDGEWIIGKDVK